jgi:hypothetical protein
VLAWYRREDYDRMRALAPDGGGMEKTLDVWIKIAECMHKEIITKGQRVKKFIVDPDAFAAFLKRENAESNPETRALYVWKLAEAHYSKH